MQDTKLSVYCKKCNKKKECDETQPYPYDNPVWHSCIHKQEIVEDMLGGL